MTDAVLRFLVELEDAGLKKLKVGLGDVVRVGDQTTKATQRQSKQQTDAVERILQKERAAALRTVQNASVRHAAVRRQIADYQAVAKASKRGSDEQVTASMLAARAERRLARETAASAGSQVSSYHRMGYGARGAERDLERLVRGTIIGSGALHRLRGSLAFATTAVIGGAGFGFALRSIYEEATKAEAGEKSLETQLTASGISYARHGKQIDEVVKKQAYYAAVNEHDVQASLIGLIRTTRNLNAAYKLNTIALDLSAGAHIPLATASNVVAKVFLGNIGILRRYQVGLAGVKTPLQALIALSQRYAGQGANTTTGGALERAQEQIHTFERGFGSGALPVIGRELNKLTGALDNSDLEHSAEQLGRKIATDVGGAIDTIVSDVRANWPEIKQGFQDAETVLSDSATAAQGLAAGLREIAHLVPAKGSVLTLLAELYLGKRLLLGKGGSAAAGAEAGGGGGGLLGLVEGLAGGAVGAKLAQGRAGLAGRLTLRNPAVLRLLGIGIAGDYVRRKLHEDAPNPFDFSFKKGPGLNFVLGHGWRSDTERARAAKQATKENGAAVDELAAKYKQMAADSAGSWNAVKGAMNAEGVGLDTQKKKLEEIVKAEQRAAAAAVSALDSGYSRLTGDLDKAFDAKTQQIIDGISNTYDDRLQKQLDSISYKVNVVGKGLRESFTLHGDQKTPAERELDALNRIDERHNFQRDTLDARLSLAEAQATGDPAAIRDAQRRLQDANSAKRRYQLEPRAQLERKQADAAKAAAQKALTDRSNAAKAAAVKEVQARRDLEKRHLDDTLAALLKEAEKGKLAGDQLAKKVLDVLRKHGIDFQAAGGLLGKAFSTQLGEDLDTVKGKADDVGGAFDRIAATKDRIKELTAQIAKLAAQLKDVADKAQAAKKQIGVKAFNAYLASTYTVDGSDPWKKAQKKAAGGFITGPAGIDKVPTWLTAGELVLTAADQRTLAGLLGVRDRKQILDRLRGTIGKNSLAQIMGRRVNPTPIESLVTHTLRRSERTKLGNTGLKNLEQTLAQAQAHPVLSGLITPTATGGHLGGIRRPFGATISRGAFTGNITIEINGAQDPVATARATRRELLKVMGRNGSLGFDD
jgi:hypothetical protein